ncbi:hypothetical protein HZB04_04000 [Candidatus Wolfebacteria bacterium]|nr:hypothetical protein [Candidatus Wolfebacteria bacterium]
MVKENKIQSLLSIYVLTIFFLVLLTIAIGIDGVGYFIAFSSIFYTILINWRQGFKLRNIINKWDGFPDAVHYGIISLFITFLILIINQYRLSIDIKLEKNNK